MKRLVLALVVLTFALSATAAFADGIDIATVGGTWTLTNTNFTATAGGTGNATFTALPGGNQVSLNSVINVTSGTLSSGGGGIWVFNPGGSVTVTGTGCPAGGCFIGTFLGAQFDILNDSFTGTFVAGNVDPSIWTLLGLPSSPAGATGSLGITTTLANANGFSLANFTTGSGTITSSDLNLTRVVPEPASLALLGTAFLLGGATIRRKFAL